MTRRCELTDEQYALVEDLMPATGKPGGRWTGHRAMLDGIFWVFHTGAQWREPERYGNRKTVYDQPSRFRRDGTIGRILERPLMKLGGTGGSTWVCGASIGLDPGQPLGGGCRRGEEVGGEPEDHALGRSRGGFGTKLHLVVDGHGTPLAATLTPGQAHEPVSLEMTPEAVRLPRKDQRPNPKLDKTTYRRRNVVERCRGLLKENRRVGTRHEKLAVNYLAMVYLAIQRCLRMLESPDKTLWSPPEVMTMVSPRRILSSPPKEGHHAQGRLRPIDSGAAC